MEVNRGVGIALWRQIQSILENEITTGAFAPGQRLPTEQMLAARFEVNRHTIRRSLAQLSERGLVRIEQGRGTFVQENVVDYALGKRTRFSENLSRQSRIPGGRMTRGLKTFPPREARRALDIPAETEIILIETVGEADGQPISFSSHYFPAPRFPGLITSYRAHGSITATLKHYGVHDYLRKSTRITARMPVSLEAGHLRMPRNRPILVTESVNIDSRGIPIEFGITRFSSDWVQLVVET